MPVVEVSVVPLGTGTPSLSGYVAECHRLLQKAKGVKYQLTPMSTILEGDLDSILPLIRELHEVPFRMGIQRVATSVKK